MKLEDFKNILRESIESAGENWINEISLSGYSLAIGAHKPYISAWKLAFHRFIDKKKKEFQKQNPGSNIVFSPTAGSPGNAEYAAVEKEFRNILKSLGIDKNMDMNKWNDIHTNFHKKYFLDPSSNKGASDALHNYIASRKKEETSGGEDKFKRSLEYALYKYDQEHQSIGNYNAPDIKEKFKQDLDVFISPQGNLEFDPKKWKEMYDEYHKANEVFDGDKVSDAIHNYVLQQRGYEDDASKDEFRRKGIGKDIEPKLTDAINKIKVLLNKDHNIDTFEALLAYGALGKWFRNPKYMEGIILSPDSYGMWVKNLFAALNEKNKMMSTKQIVDEVRGWINKSKLYQLKPPVLLKKMLEKDELQNLNNLNNALDIIPKLKIPSGFMGNRLRKKIEALMSTEAGKRQELNESLDHQHLKVHLDSFMPFIKKRLNYDKDPEINFISDPANGKKLLGKTAQYDPSSMAVTIFVDNRHPKDIMRSLSHELVHHAQNCDGQFDNLGAMGEGYAQSDEHLRKMEEDAYLRGNMIFRDWEDGYKQTNRAFGNSLTERKERKYYELKRRLW